MPGSLATLSQKSPNSAVLSHNFHRVKNQMKKSLFPVVTDQHFIDWESHVFGYGYGDGEPEIVPAIASFLKMSKEDGYIYVDLQARFGKLAAWLLINTLCKADIIDYGASPRCGFLTEKGHSLADYFETRAVDQILDLFNRPDDENSYCHPTHCNCDKPCNNPLFLETR